MMNEITSSASVKQTETNTPV